MYNNAQVPLGSDVTIDISSIPGDQAVICELSLDGKWYLAVSICTAFLPQYTCNPGNQYQGRSRFFNETTLLITGVLKNESGIYRCRKVGVETPVLIPGVIIVGMYNCLL